MAEMLYHLLKVDVSTAWRKLYACDDKKLQYLERKLHIDVALTQGRERELHFFLFFSASSLFDNALLLTCS